MRNEVEGACRISVDLRVPPSEDSEAPSGKVRSRGIIAVGPPLRVDDNA